MPLNPKSPIFSGSCLYRGVVFLRSATLRGCHAAAGISGRSPSLRSVDRQCARTSVGCRPSARVSSPRVRSGAPLSARPRTRLPLATFALARPPSSPASGAGAPLAPYLVSVVSWALRGGCGWRVGGLHAALPATTCRPSRGGAPSRPPPARVPPPALPPSSPAAIAAPSHSYLKVGFVFVGVRCNPPLSITAV